MHGYLYTRHASGNKTGMFLSITMALVVLVGTKYKVPRLARTIGIVDVFGDESLNG